MAGLSGPSSRVAKALGGSRAGAFMARGMQKHGKLLRTAPDWMAEGEQNFQWEPIAGAAIYVFTIFDQADNVVWSSRVTEPQTDYPADLPALALRQPYVWRVAAFGKMGKPSGLTNWGMLTFLSRLNADELTARATALQEQIDATPGDATPRLMLAELYRDYGVYEKTVTILEDPKLANQPGIDEAIANAYKHVSRYAYFLASPPAPPSDALDETSQVK